MTISKEQIKGMKRFWKTHREKSIEELDKEFHNKMEDISKWGDR